jgi:Na+/proline symporter
MQLDFKRAFDEKKIAVLKLVKGIHDNDRQEIDQAKKSYHLFRQKEDSIKMLTKQSIAKGMNLSIKKVNDTDYIFLNFVLKYLPHGIVGLLLAVIFSAAMSSMASELSALASTTTVDVYKRIVKANAESSHYLVSSKWFTILWALLAMGFAMLASFAENLIQFVNIVGSLFYGTILGIFLVAFYIKHVKSSAVFWAAILAESVVLACYFYFYQEIAFLYYNIIGCGVVVLLSVVFQMLNGRKEFT